MARIERVGINNIPQVNNIRTDHNKEIHETFKGKLDKIEQEQIRDQLKLLYDKIETQSSKLQDKLFIEDLVERQT